MSLDATTLLVAAARRSAALAWRGSRPVARVTVPAGTFDTVHYIRTSQSTDEYWKSLEHGVVVKHVATLPMGTMTEVLSAIR